MPLKVCNHPGCNELIKHKERFCSKHKQINIQDLNRDYDSKRRNKEHDKFYHSAQWKRVREVVMKNHAGLCIRCKDIDKLVAADVVDHIVPLTKDFDQRLDIDNLQPLCHSCHAKKTSDDEKIYREGL